MMVRIHAMCHLLLLRFFTPLTFDRHANNKMIRKGRVNERKDVQVDPRILVVVLIDKSPRRGCDGEQAKHEGSALTFWGMDKFIYYHQQLLRLHTPEEDKEGKGASQ